MAGETGFSRFPGNLDPGAPEFWPGRRMIYLGMGPTQAPPQMYYGPPFLQSTQMSFCELQYFSTAPAHFGPSAAPAAPPAATRALLLSWVPSDVSETRVRRDLEVFGEVRAVQMERVREGFVGVHFYDLRHAQGALLEIRGQRMQEEASPRGLYGAVSERGSAIWNKGKPPGARGLVGGRAVWAQFILPADAGFPGCRNQGTVVVFNLEREVSESSLKQMFEIFGAVKEVRETPSKKQKFVEFYDVRHAERALREMNFKKIGGRRIIIEFSRPGGHYGKNTVTRNLTEAVEHGVTTPPLPPPCANNLAVGNGNAAAAAAARRAKSGGLEGAMGALSLSSGQGRGFRVVGPRKRQSKSGSGNCKSASPATERVDLVGPPPRILTGHMILSPDFYEIDENALSESSCRDSRTTLMIKNIPNKYSQELLINVLDRHCRRCNERIEDGDDQPLSAYDFLYLPIDFQNKCNVGYAFVNLTSPQAAFRLYKGFHRQPWEAFNSRKICEVTYARLQGLRELREHFQGSKFGCAPHYLPVVFTPPRDGKELTEPQPIGRRASNSPITGVHTGDDDAAARPEFGLRVGMTNGPDVLGSEQPADVGDGDDDESRKPGGKAVAAATITVA